MNSGKIPPLFLEKWLLDELDQSSRERLLADFGKEAIDLELAKLKKSNQEFFATADSSEMLARISRAQPALNRKGVNRIPQKLRWPLMVLPLAAALFLTIFLPQLWRQQQDDIRIKGEVKELTIYKKTGDKIIRLETGATCQAGDVIQIAFNPGSEKYHFIFSIDGNGLFTTHLPEEGEQQPGERAATANTTLHAYKLDNAPRFERFYYIRSQKPIPYKKITEKAKAFARNHDMAKEDRLPLPQDQIQSSFLIKKAGP
jgi:hypothetical protein